MGTAVVKGLSGVDLDNSLRDGAILFLYRAARCARENDEYGRRVAVRRVADILMHLQARVSSSEDAERYSSLVTSLLESSHNNSAEGFEALINTLHGQKTLQEASL